jgi:hypothetical protein
MQEPPDQRPGRWQPPEGTSQVFESMADGLHFCAPAGIEPATHGLGNCYHRWHVRGRLANYGNRVESR